MNKTTLVSAAVAAVVSGAIALGAATYHQPPPPPAQAAPAQVVPTQAAVADKPSIERRVHRYIVEHPEVITEAIEVLRARQRDQEIETARQIIAENQAAIYDDSGSVVAGNPDGDVTIVEFFDYNCPYCKRAAPILAKLRGEDPGIRLIYKEFPVLGPVSVVAARAALAAHKQGKYEAFHDALISSRDKLTRDIIWRQATAAGLDVERLAIDMKDPEIEKIIQRNMALARKLRISGTPSFVIGDTLIPGFVERSYLDNVIAEARKQGS